MLLGFEGTGPQRSGRTNWHEKGNIYGERSFIKRFCDRSKEPNSTKYFPGPNVQGSNCIEVFNEAVKFFNDCIRRTGNRLTEKVNLVGYSRGAYLAMCFAKFLEEKNVPVNFLGMFDAVSRDMSVEKKYQARLVPRNVQKSYLASRSPVIGSRSITMDYAGANYEGNAGTVNQKVLPGSHASMGGFPNDSGFADSPNLGQGDPDQPDKFHPQKEMTAWWLAADHISAGAISAGVIGSQILNDKTRPKMMPESEWYVLRLPKDL